ncbi:MULTISPECIES: hypothetical protein [unclassified Providencia]|uniref:hypothetical protein n=1 Tax=unclassified Providencia TaxID=2633465 RepID=UPI00234BB1B3|nr:MULTISPECIES: hypothetical protein [unclassified Providencia]
MNNDKASNLLKIASYSSASKLLKVISGPITLLVIGKKLSIEEIGFYFTFFNLIAMQQLAELGIGHVIKQSIAHSIYKNENSFKIKSYFYFSAIWFAGISVFILIFVGYGGVLFYSSYDGNVEWLYPWWTLVISTSFVTLFLPILLLLEGSQRQLKLYKSQAVSSIINPFAICISLYFNFGLYSISVGLLLSNIALLFLLYTPFRAILGQIRSYNYKFTFKLTFNELWPLLSKVSIVWGLGFVFWNGFNLIAFKTLPPTDAGKIIFTFTLAKAGFSISESITQSHMTLYAAQISQNKIKQTYLSFLRYRKLAILTLMVGYGLFMALNTIIPGFYIFHKTSPTEITSQIFLFFITLLLLTTNNNFIRCFKVEPFVYVSTYHSILCPVVFYFSCLYLSTYLFIPCTIIILGSIFWSKKISSRFLTSI